MAEKSGFFNGKMLKDDLGYPLLHEDGSEVYDREYTAAEHAMMFDLYLTSGIRNGGTNLKVISAGGLNVNVLTGDGMVKGYFYKLIDTPKLFVLEKNTGSQTRFDTIVIRLNLKPNVDEGRRISTELKQSFGSPAPLQRDNEIWELQLAEISVPPSWDGITDAQIKDTRLDSSLCGLINSLVQVDTELLFNQIDAYFQQKQEEWNAISNEWSTWVADTEAEWYGWFNQIKIELFSQANTDFDDWSRHGGYNKETKFPNPNRIEETLKNRFNGTVQATRVTEFIGNDIKETLHYNEPLLTAVKTTKFVGNDIIEEVV